MGHLEIIRVPARMSRLGVDEVYYDVMGGDWHDRAKRLQIRRWYKLERLPQTHRVVHIQVLGAIA